MWNKQGRLFVDTEGMNFLWTLGGSFTVLSLLVTEGFPIILDLPLYKVFNVSLYIYIKFYNICLYEERKF